MPKPVWIVPVVVKAIVSKTPQQIKCWGPGAVVPAKKVSVPVYGNFTCMWQAQAAGSAKIWWAMRHTTKFHWNDVCVGHAHRLGES